jgi:tryptophanase
MLYREIMAVCSEIHTNTLCGQNVELLNVKLVVHIVTTGLQKVKSQL